MNPPASGTRHGLVDFPIGQVISSPALHDPIHIPLPTKRPTGVRREAALTKINASHG